MAGLAASEKLQLFPNKLWFKMTLTSFPLKYGPLVSSGSSSALPRQTHFCSHRIALCSKADNVWLFVWLCPHCSVCLDLIASFVHPQSAYPFLCGRTLRLLPAIGNCEQCCCEHVCTCMIMHVHKHTCMCVCESLGIYPELEFLCSYKQQEGRKLYPMAAGAYFEKQEV